MKKELLLFCSSNYFNINENLIKNRYNLFDEVKLLNENDLDNYIKKIVNDIITKYDKKGYGYWIWKSYIILQELNVLNDDDILVFLDIHCIDDNLKNKFDDIINKLQHQPVIIGKLGYNDLIYTTSKLRKHVEKYLNYKFTDDQLNNIQYEGGLIFVRNCQQSRTFIEQWFNIMLSGIEYITNIYNDDAENHHTFIENRHDQSVVSLLYKYYNFKTPVYLDWNFMNIKNDTKKVMKIPFDKVYVISYVKNNERQEIVKNYFNNVWNIEFEFIYGIDANSLINIINYDNIKFVTENTHDLFKYRIGYVSSTIAHYTAVQHAYEHNYNSCLIIEDDAIFTNDLDYIQYCFDNIPQDADSCRFGLTWRDQGVIDKLNDFWILDEDYVGGQCYSLNNRETMLTFMYRMSIDFMEADDMRLLKNKNVYQLKTLICNDINSSLKIK